MALPTFEFCPEFGAREIREPKTRPFRFGNGSERRYRFGLNNDLRKWELQFDFRNEEQREEILEFLEDRGGWKRFNWTDPKGYFALWRCPEWTTTWNGHVQYSIRCVFEEDEIKVAQEFEPPDLGLADMWLSRATTPVENAFNGSAILTSDGGSYQTAWVREAETPFDTQFYIFKRNLLGVQVWQKKIVNIDQVGISKIWYRPALHVDQQDNLYVVMRRTEDLSTGSQKEFLVAWRINNDGTIAWQKDYQFDGATGFAGSFRFINSYFDKTTQFIYAYGTTQFAGSISFTTAIVLSIASSDGTIQKSIGYRQLLRTDGGTDIDVGAGRLQARNGRLWWSLESRFNSVNYGLMQQISLDLETVFTSWRYSGFAAPRIPFPASDGGWYCISEFPGRILKLSGSGAPLWMQKDVLGTGAWPRLGMQHESTGDNGLIRYANSFLAPNVKKGFTQNQSNTLKAIKFDHEVTRAGLEATQMSPGGGNALSTGSNSGLNIRQVLDETLGIALGFSSRAGDVLQGYRIIAYGHRTVYEDDAVRYMDTGTEVNSNFFAEVRSQLDGTYGPLIFDEAEQLPLQTDYFPPREEVTFTAVDTSFQIADGILALAYYNYSDPEYIAPAEEGSAGFAYYTGNNSVQKVSVGAQFTPAFLVVANRAASNRKSWFNQFFDDRAYHDWTGARAGITLDGLVDLAPGNFKIAGRMDSLNLVNNSFVAFALGLLAGAHAIVTYTGNGAIRTVNHPLGAAPEFISIFPRLGNTSTFAGTAFGGTNYSFGSGTETVFSSTSIIRAISDSSIELGVANQINANNAVYDMHVFRSSDDWTIGTANGPGGSTLTVLLGFKPKAILFKGITGIGTAFQLLYRPDGTAGIAKSLPLNAGTAVEADSAIVSITADGFTIADGAAGNTGTSTAFYMAIKEPGTPAATIQYAVFTSSGTWDWEDAGSPSRVDVLLVGGGGGGGAWRGGGGGAGGVRIAQGITVSGDVAVTVGAGGSGNTGGESPVAAQDGGLSSFGAQQAAGGGFGGSGQNENNGAGNGGSGGGAGGAATTNAQPAGTGTAGQGSGGGNSFNDFDAIPRAGGGGGGKAAAGQNATTGAGGNGGNGVTLTSIGFGGAIEFGAPASVGGGGGGSSNSGSSGSGGLGGGGAGSVSDNAASGTPNTGGGGGGAGGGFSATNQGGAGGSGLVVVRWFVTAES
jgi:phage-related protein